jgi:hypothetical protein
MEPPLLVIALDMGQNGTWYDGRYSNVKTVGLPGERVKSVFLLELSSFWLLCETLRALGEKAVAD